MSDLSILSTYPNNGDTGIPVGITIKLYFNYGVDEKSLKDSVALYGRDFDVTSGPDQAIWVNEKTGDNPFFLTSPGFKGLIPLKFTFGYYTIGTTTEVTPVITSNADEITANVGSVVSIVIDPKYNAVLPADNLLTLIIAGDPSTQDLGVSTRTVFDIVANGANSGTGSMSVWGTWINTGASNDEVNVQITAVGSPGVAEYKWWYTSAGTGSAVTRVLSSRRFRTLSDGLQIRFTGTELAVGDKWVFNVAHTQRLPENTTLSFTTNDGSYSAAPASPSTPATSEPSTSVLPTSIADFEVLSMIPENGSYNISVKNRKIVITCSEDVDDTTVTNASVKLWKYPVDGVYDETYSPVELQKTIEVIDNIITIRF